MYSVPKRHSSEERLKGLKCLFTPVSGSFDAEGRISRYVDTDNEHGTKEALISRDLDREKQEEQVTEMPTITILLKYELPLRTKSFYLSTYLLLSLALTIHSKMLFTQFKFPFILTAFHTGITSLGCCVVMLGGHIKLSELSLRDNLMIVAFSMLCTINIAISNVSLVLVSVAFHQIVRSIAPVATMFVYKLWFGRSYSNATLASCIPITVGVSMVAYGEMDFTAMGFVLTLLGVCVAVTKTIITNTLMIGSLAIPALEVLLRISPLAAFQALIYALYTGEVAAFKSFIDDGHLTTGWMIALITNSSLAFLLNVSSFHANKVTGALTMSVCGNLKQILTVFLGIIIFNLRIGALNGLGVIVAILGGVYYTKVELSNK